MNTARKICLLFFFIAICAGATLIRYRADVLMERVNPVDLYSVVNQQLKALHTDDFPAAYAHASTGLQQKFTLAQFADMIRTDYPRIARADHVEFGGVELRGRHALIQVFFIGHDTQVIPCIYALVNEGNGWKVDGVQILQRGHARLKLNGIQS